MVECRDRRNWLRFRKNNGQTLARQKMDLQLLQQLHSTGPELDCRYYDSFEGLASWSYNNRHSTRVSSESLNKWNSRVQSTQQASWPSIIPDLGSQRRYNYPNYSLIERQYQEQDSQHFVYNRYQIQRGSFLINKFVHLTRNRTWKRGFERTTGLELSNVSCSNK